MVAYNISPSEALAKWLRGLPVTYFPSWICYASWILLLKISHPTTWHYTFTSTTTSTQPPPTPTFPQFNKVISWVFFREWLRNESQLKSTIYLVSWSFPGCFCLNDHVLVTRHVSSTISALFLREIHWAQDLRFVLRSDIVLCKNIFFEVVFFQLNLNDKYCKLSWDSKKLSHNSILGPGNLGELPQGHIW